MSAKGKTFSTGIVVGMVVYYAYTNMVKKNVA